MLQSTVNYFHFAICSQIKLLVRIKVPIWVLFLSKWLTRKLWKLILSNQNMYSYVS